MSNACDANAGQQFGQSFGYSLLNLIGMGGLLEQAVPTPLDKLQSQIKSEQKSTQQLLNNFMLTYSTLTADEMLENTDLISSVNDTLTSEI